MLTLCIISAFIAGTLIAGWFALIVQSLGSTGSQQTFFASECDLRREPDDDYLFVLLSNFTFYDSNGVKWTAPRSMQTDGASVGAAMTWPLVGLLIRWLIAGDPLTGPLAPAAVPHDYIYAGASDGSWWRALISMRRAVGDRVIFEAARCTRYVIKGKTILRKTPLQTWRAFLVMAILRILGAKAYLDDSRASQSLERMKKKGTR